MGIRCRIYRKTLAQRMMPMRRTRITMIAPVTTRCWYILETHHIHLSERSTM